MSSTSNTELGSISDAVELSSQLLTIGNIDPQKNEHVTIAEAILKASYSVAKRMLAAKDDIKPILDRLESIERQMDHIKTELLLMLERTKKSTLRWIVGTIITAAGTIVGIHMFSIEELDKRLEYRFQHLESRIDQIDETISSRMQSLTPYMHSSGKPELPVRHIWL